CLTLKSRFRPKVDNVPCYCLEAIMFYTTLPYRLPEIFSALIPANITEPPILPSPYPAAPAFQAVSMSDTHFDTVIPMVHLVNPNTHTLCPRKPPHLICSQTN